MLGPPKSRRLEEPIAVSLEELVPHNNFYRHLETKLDLSFVRGWARELYADRGRPSIDPVVFFKLQLLMFFEGIRSERKLIETASLHLAHRWYLGYALDEALPDHSSLTRIRQRLGVAIFERFFERIVDLYQEAGLVWGRELFFDATKIQANADLDSLVPRASSTRPRPTLLSSLLTLQRPLPRLRRPWEMSSLQGFAGSSTILREEDPPGTPTHPGDCWKSGGWIRSVRHLAATFARPTSG
jgi:transposase